MHTNAGYSKLYLKTKYISYAKCFIERYNMYKKGPKKSERVTQTLPTPLYTSADVDGRKIRLDGWFIIKSLVYEKEAKFLAGKKF